MSRVQLVPAAWMDESACVARPDLPWLDDDAGMTALSIMAGLCQGCAVLDECEAYVRDAGIVGGFWAGHDRGPTRTPVQGVLFGQAG